jgi:hypothetical protein
MGKLKMTYVLLIPGTSHGGQTGEGFVWRVTAARPGRWPWWGAPRLRSGWYSPDTEVEPSGAESRTLLVR